MFEILISKFNAYLYLAVFALAIWALFPVFSLISCWMRKEVNHARQYLWTLLILATWPLGSFGGIIFGLFCFKNLPGRILSLISLIIMSLLLLLPTPTKKNSEIFAETLEKSGFSTIEPIINDNINKNITDERMRKELTDNFRTISGEYNDNKSDSERKAASKHLTVYLYSISDNKVTQKEYTNWRNLFHWRKDLKSNQIKMIIETNEAAERNLEIMEQNTASKSSKDYERVAVGGMESYEINFDFSELAATSISEKKIFDALANLNSPDYTAFEKSVYLFEKMGEKSLPYLLKHLEENKNDHVIKRNTIYTIGRVGSNAYKASQEISPYLRDLDTDTRAVTATALGKMGAKDAIPLLAITQYDDDKWVAKCANEALKKIGTERAMLAANEFDEIKKLY